MSKNRTVSLLFCTKRLLKICWIVLFFYKFAFFLQIVSIRAHTYMYTWEQFLLYKALLFLIYIMTEILKALLLLICIMTEILKALFLLIYMMIKKRNKSPYFSSYSFPRHFSARNVH